MKNVASIIRASFSWALSLSLLATSTVTPALVADKGVEACADATHLMLNETFRVYENSSEGDYYEVYIPFPGILTLDVAVRADSAAEPKLAFFGQDCQGSEDALVIKRYVAGMALVIKTPGIYAFAVAAQDPLLSFSEYKVRTGFESKPEPELHKVVEGEADPDPEKVVEGEADPDPEKVVEGEADPDPEKVVEGEADPDPDHVVALAEGLLNGLMRITPTRTIFSSSSAFEACRAGEVDDHGDIFICATSLNLGVGVTAELANAWDDDDDVFSFVLTAQRTVRIETSGDTDTIGVLYDRYGHRLAIGDEGGDGSGFRIVKTLGPGQYFVRVAGTSAAEGIYTFGVVGLSW